MGTPYGNEFRITTTGANERVALDFPGRCELTRIAIFREGTGSIAADIYNRQTVGPELAVGRIVDDGNSFAKIILATGESDFDNIQIDDLLTVAANSVGGYNVATHRITEIDPNRRFVVTSEAYSADGTGGTVNLDISSLEVLQQVLTQITGTDSVIVTPPGTGDVTLFVNQDPILPGARNIGVKRKLYMKFGAAATYRVAIDATLSVAGEG